MPASHLTQVLAAKASTPRLAATTHETARASANARRGGAQLRRRLMPKSPYHGDLGVTRAPERCAQRCRTRALWLPGRAHRSDAGAPCVRACAAREGP